MHCACAGGPGFLWYLCELFTLFIWTIYVIRAKNRTTIYWLRTTREIGCWTEGLTDARAEGWPGAWTEDASDSLPWGVGGALVRSSQIKGDRSELSLTFGSTEFLIYIYPSNIRTQADFRSGTSDSSSNIVQYAMQLNAVLQQLGALAIFIDLQFYHIS